MARRLSKSELCSSCLAIRPRMNDGSLDDAVSVFMDSDGYKKPEGPSFINPMLLVYLEDNGGCQKCINVIRGA